MEHAGALSCHSNKPMTKQLVVILEKADFSANCGSRITAVDMGVDDRDGAVFVLQMICCCST
jgi:hypothetical protein